MFALKLVWMISAEVVQVEGRSHSSWVHAIPVAVILVRDCKSRLGSHFNTKNIFFQGHEVDFVQILCHGVELPCRGEDCPDMPRHFGHARSHAVNAVWNHPDLFYGVVAWTNSAQDAQDTIADSCKTCCSMRFKIFLCSITHAQGGKGVISSIFL